MLPPPEQPDPGAPPAPGADGPPPRVETLCATAREGPPVHNLPLIAPIYQSAVWALDSVAQCEAVYGGEVPGYIYTRDANPNHTALESIVALLEGAPAAVAFASGMAAVAAALTGLCAAGQRVVAARQVYGATSRLLEGELARFGLAFQWVDATDLPAVAAALRPGAGVLLVETLSNPLLEVADLPALAQLAHHHGARLVVDNTFASPLCCRPLLHGADLTLHSVTKFLSGHSDVTLGAAAGSEELMAVLRRQARLWGGAANPFEAWLALRGVTTFPLRMERACANALALAQRLQAHPAVTAVHYPGLPTHPQHALARRLLTGSGAMLAFQVADGETAAALLAALRLVRFAPSLGDTATTISYPVATSHRGLPPQALAAAGISPGLLRLSVGIDAVDDVWEDLRRALPATGSAPC